MTGIILDTRAITHFLYHFQIIVGALFNALGFNELVMLLEKLDLLLHLCPDGAHGNLQIFLWGYIMRCGENHGMNALAKNFSRQHIKFHNAINLVTKHLNAHPAVIVSSRKNLHHITTNPKMATLQHHIIAVILHIYQPSQNIISVYLLPLMKGKHHFVIALRGAKAIDT